MMAVADLASILDRLKNYEPEELDDNYLGLLEDISDSMATDAGTWEEELGKLRLQVSELEQKVKDTDAEWRNRYRDRFYGRSEETLAEQEAQDLEEDETEEFKSVEEIAEDW